MLTIKPLLDFHVEKYFMYLLFQKRNLLNLLGCSLIKHNTSATMKPTCHHFLFLIEAACFCVEAVRDKFEVVAQPQRGKKENLPLALLPSLNNKNCVFEHRCCEGGLTPPPPWIFFL